MTILRSSSALLARQVRLIVSPPTSTLFESRAILSDIQSKFGSVSTFINQRNDPVLHRLLESGSKADNSLSQPPSQTILAVFESPVSKQSALNSSSINISCGGDLLSSAEELDPYNARGFHGRHHPPKRNFTCRIVEEDDPTIQRHLRENSPYSGPFRINKMQMSYGDLVRSGAPLEEMADVMQADRLSETAELPTKQGQRKLESRFNRSEGFYSHNSRQPDSQHTGGLMGAWRRGMEKDKMEEEPQGL
jgi:hypothetical protein